MMYGYLVPEGDLDEAVLKKMLRYVGQTPEHFVVLSSYKGRRDKIFDGSANSSKWQSMHLYSSSLTWNNNTIVLHPKILS